MITVLPSITPAEAFRERELLREAHEEIMASPELMDEMLRRLGLDQSPETETNKPTTMAMSQTATTHKLATRPILLLPDGCRFLPFENGQQSIVLPDGTVCLTFSAMHNFDIMAFKQAEISGVPAFIDSTDD